MKECVKMVDAAIDMVNGGEDAGAIVAVLNELKAAFLRGDEAKKDTGGEKAGDAHTRSAMGLKAKQ